MKANWVTDHFEWDTGATFFCVNCPGDTLSGEGILEVIVEQAGPHLVTVNVIQGDVRYEITEIWTKNGQECVEGLVAAGGQSASAGDGDSSGVRQAISHIEICFRCCADDLD